MVCGSQLCRPPYLINSSKGPGFSDNFSVPTLTIYLFYVSYGDWRVLESVSEGKNETT